MTTPDKPQDGNQSSPSGKAAPRGLAGYLDPVFLPLGLTGETHGLAGRDYVGEIDGRAIKVHCSMRRRTRYAGDIRYGQYIGHRLEITVGTPVKSRLVLSPSSGFLMRLVRKTNSWFGVKPVTDLTEMYDGWLIDAADPDWARRFLMDGRVQRAVRALIPAVEQPPNIGLKLGPESWIFSQRLPLQQITPEAGRTWVNALRYLAGAAEVLPPTVESERTWYEEQSKKNPTMMAFFTAGLLLGVPFLILMSCFVCAVTIIFLTGM